MPRPSDEARLERTRCVLSLHWHGRKRKQEKAVTPQGHVNVWHVGGGLWSCPDSQSSTDICHSRGALRPASVHTRERAPRRPGPWRGRARGEAGRAVTCGADKQEAFGACDGAETGPRGVVGAKEGRPAPRAPCANPQTGRPPHPPGQRAPAPASAGHGAGSGDRPCPHTIRNLDSLRASPFSSADIEAGSLPVGASRRPWGVEQHPRPQPLDSKSASSPV